MFLGTRRIRSHEKREAWAAFGMLFGLIFGHSVLETARDALFLKSIDSTRLPWVYIGIAIVSLAITQLQSRLGRSMNRRRALSVWTASAAVVTLGFWALLARMGDAGLYALYVWSGVLTTLVLVHFWTLLGSIFSVTQAKRLYGFIGTGSVLGAILGSAGAGVMATFVDARHLLVVSSVGFLLTAAVPTLFEARESESRGGSAKDGLIESALFVWRQPYALRVAMFVVVSTMALTLGDYIFKATVATHVAPDNLAGFFGATYLVLNILSLISQVGIVALVIRRFDLATALSILPVLILVSTVGFLVVPGLIAAMAIKGADGTLKHSVHRTSTELMFVPFTDRSRARVKAFIDVVGQRGGQTIASVAVLIFAATNSSLPWVAAALAIVSVLWIIGAVDIRRHYVDVFRSRVRQGFGAHDFPDIDVASLATLIQTLDSENDAEVLAALEVLEREGRSRLVPGLILYHPSEEVVVRSLGLFIRNRRQRISPALDRLMDHPSRRVRAAAVGAHAHLAPDERLLRMRLSLEESPEVRAAIMVNLVAIHAITGSEAQDFLTGVVRHGSVETKVALAEAVHRSEDRALAHVLVRLADDANADVQRAAAAAMSMAPLPEFITVLTKLLTNDPTGATAMRTLLRYGDEVFDELVTMLVSEATNVVVRRRLPQLLCAFDRPEVPMLLLDRLLATHDGKERYRLVLALEALVQRNPALNFDEAKVWQSVESNLGRAYRYLDRRLTLEAGAAEVPSRQTPGHELLVRALRDKQVHALDRVLRLVGVLFPGESFARIRRDATSSNQDVRANAIELIENLVRPPLRGEVVALIDLIPDRERLEAGQRLHHPRRTDYEGLLKELLASSSTAMQDIAIFHIGELRLASFTRQLESLERPDAEAGDLRRTLALLTSSPEVSHAS